MSARRPLIGYCFCYCCRAPTRYEVYYRSLSQEVPRSRPVVYMSKARFPSIQHTHTHTHTHNVRLGLDALRSGCYVIGCVRSVLYLRCLRRLRRKSTHRLALRTARCVGWKSDFTVFESSGVFRGEPRCDAPPLAGP